MAKINQTKKATIHHFNRKAMKKNTLLTKAYLTLFFLFVSLMGFAQSSKTYSSSGTFTVPAGVTTLDVQAWGAGGGGSTITSKGKRGAGGGGGAYAGNPTVTVSAIALPYTVTVGTGGGANSSGGNSSFSSSVIAVGGGGAGNDSNTTYGIGGTAAASTGSTKYSGGDGADGGTTNSGGGGGGAGSSGNGATALLNIGGNGGTGSGGKGADGSSGSNNGNTGNTFGGGGSGAVTNSKTDRTGGSGANGQVILNWTCPTYSITATSIASPLCTTNGAVVTLTGGAGLPIGNYTVSYTLSGTNTGSNTATMSVTTAGTGSFTTSALNNVGLTSIRINTLSSGVSPDNCSSTIAVNSASTASVTLTAIPPQPSSITGNTTVCNGATSQAYSVIDVPGTTYTWTAPSGWVQTSGGTTNSVTFTVGSGSGNISVTPSNGCVGPARTLAITSTNVPLQPSSIIGSASPCVGTSQTYSVTNVSGTDYAWTFPSGWTQTGGGTTNSVTVTTNGTSGTIQVTPSNGCGSGTSRTLATTVNSLPTTANAGTDQTLAACATTATLAGNTPTVGSGTWSVISGTATITTPSSATSGITGLIVGSTATLRWTTTNGGCIPSTDDVIITTVIGSACLNYCTPTYSNGPGTTDQITNVTLGTLNNTSGASTSPYYTYYNAVTIPNLTASTTASVSVTFGTDSTQYAAVWIDFNQNGTFEASEGVVSTINAGANGTTIINIPIPSGALTGNTRMRIRGGDDSALTTSQACGASNSTYGETEDYIVNIVASTPPTITSLGTSSGCAGGSITINGTNLSGATATDVTIGGTAVSSITSNSGTVLVAVIGAGTTGTVSVTTAGGTATSAATFTVNPSPAQPSTIAGNTSPCSGSSQVYSVTNVSGVTYTWAFPSGWTQTAGGTTNSVTVTTNGNSGTVTVTPSNGCAGLARTLSVTPTSVPTQPSTITGNASPCVGTSQTYSVTNVSGTDYAWTFPSGWTQTAGGTTNSVTVTTNGTSGTISVTPSNGCGSGTSRTLITTVYSLPTNANAGIDQTLAACATTATLAANTPTVGTGSWTVVSGTASITTPSSATSGITGLIVGSTATLRWTITNGSCSTSTDDVIITTVLGSGCMSYCTPTYSTGSGSGNSITNVTLGTLNNSTSASSNPYYTFYNAATIPNLTQATTASVSITFGSNSNQYAAVWIDFNQNYTFEANEGAVSVANTAANGTTIITISVPEGALTGNTRMRVRGGDNNALSINQACGASNNGNGETEDYIVNITATTPLTNGPGGVLSNLQIWLRSDLLNGTTSVADNTSVSTWNTQARGTDAIKPTNTGAPVYKNNPTANINFNSVVDFTNDYANAPLIYTDNDITRQYLKGTSGFYSQDVFVVLMPDIPITSAVASNDIFCGDRNSILQEPDATGIGYGAYTARFSGEVLTYAIGTTSGTPPSATGYGVANISPSASYSTPGIINARNNAGISGQELYFNANNNVNTTNEPASFVNVNNSQYWIGRSEGWTGSLDGRVGEIITYSSRLTDIQRSNVQSYLAVKYGITLGINGTSMNYTNSDGNVIWNANTGVPANDVFNYDIAGIGRDDIAKLNQKQSKTVNTNDDITIGLTDIAATNTANTNTFDTDKKFLLWGNNHATLAAQPAVTVNMSTGITPALITNVEFVSVGRTWKVVETGGNVGSTKVSIPTIMLSATLTPPGDYLMFISSTPNFDPTAEYRIMAVNGSNLETSYDFDGTKYITFGFAPERTFERSISFDGSDDYLDAGKVLNLNTSFTVSSWIKNNGVGVDQTILSKRDNAFTTGYDLSINSAGKAEMSWINGTIQTITSSVVIPTGIWHNVAVSYDGTTAKLYIDGVLDVSKTMPTVPANTQSFLIAAADGVNTTSYFNGGIDEVRVWNVALTDKQLRYVMNQEILSNGLATNGKIIPNTITLNDISSIPWSNLSAYYPMSTYTYTNAKDISNNNHTAALRNLTTVDRQTAPLPYETANDGPWQTPSTWLNNDVQDLPNSVSPIEGSIDWNIVRTSHNVSSTGNKTVLGLMVNSNTITASNDTKIEVTNYLKLDGKIDLVGMSQLVQTLDCDLDVTSIGSIERDQQGQANKFNYNYWSSPVSPINAIANNTDFTVKGIMKDGFNATPREINWITGYDGIAGDATTPMSIARYWLYTFDNKANDYANWNKIIETTPIQVGKGFTMKGSGSSGTQPYTFVGKPNNGLINSNTVLSDQLLLTGNPYPSALDADAFINDNVGSVDATDGTLYFWEHYSTNTTHVLKEYQGGYGVKNLVGGVAPVSAGVDFISGSGTTSKGIPNRYIPVGQGFFVNGKLGSGGTIIFNNNQRAFFKEDDAVNSNSMYKTRSKTSKTAQIDHWNNNSNDTIKKDNYKKVRLGFNSNNNYHRQVLLGFMNEKATSGMDYGYDGISLDEIPNDMYFLNGDNQLVIQGEGYFNEDASYPIGVKTDVEGKVTFTIDALENFDAQQKIYIYDDETKTYNEIQKSAFEVTLPAGINDTRFSLRFKDKSSNTDKTLTVEENKTNTNEIKIAHIQNSNSLVINNSISDVSVLKVTLFNINGQSIANWKIENQDQQNIQIPINKISSGVYVVKLKTTTGELSKKLIVK